jgi:hypothetical protein
VAEHACTAVNPTIKAAGLKAIKASPLLTLKVLHFQAKKDIKNLLAIWDR